MVAESSPAEDATRENTVDASKGSLKTLFRIQKERINWIDQARGFVMFILVVSSMLPDAWRKANPIAHFFLEHPDNSTTVEYMNFYDVGVPAFFFIIGLLMAVSFHKRIEKRGVQAAVLNALLRWGLIFAVGVLFLVIPALISGDEFFGEVKEISPGVNWFVVRWDVVIALGTVGLTCIPFLFLKSKPRLIVSYAMMAFYQVMIMIPETHWRDYAKASVHGGIIGGFLVLVPITLIASVIGEFFILDKETPAEAKNKKLAILGIVNAAIGFGLWLIPGGFPSKRQSTMSWATISLAVCILFLFIFIWTDYKDEEFPGLNPLNKGRIILFKAYGMNPLLIYAIVEITAVLVDELIGNSFEVQLGLLFTLVPAVTLIALLLWWKGKAISTTKVALGIIIVVIALGVALVPIL